MKKLFFAHRKNILLSIVWLLALGGGVAWRVTNLNTFGLNNDEGAYLMWARLVASGYPLYAQTHSVAEPLFIEMLAFGFRLTGFGLTAARLVILLTFVGTTGVMGWLSHRIAGWVGAFLTLGMLTFTPQFFYLSRQVMAEMPATFFAVLAVAAAFRYFTHGEKRWLVLAGGSLAVSGMMKALYPAAVFPIGVFIVFHGKNWRKIITDGAIFAIALLTTLTLIVIWYPWDAFFSQAIQFRTYLRAAFPLDVSQNVAFIIVQFRPIWGVWVLAAMGFSVSVRTARGWAWTLWLLGAFAILAWHTPLFGQHLISVLPPLVLMGIECVNVGIQYWRESYPSPKRWAWMAVLIFPLLNVPAAINYNNRSLDEIGDGRENEVVQLLQTVTCPTDFVVSDNLMLPLLAKRLTPPPMNDIAFVAVRSGYQTSTQLRAISEQFKVQAVIAWVGRMAWLPEYLNWAAANFYVHREWDASHQMYFGRRPAFDDSIPHETAIDIGDSIVFRGFSVGTDEVSAGQNLPVTLYWQTTQMITVDYVIFVSLFDADGTLIATYDEQPIHGFYPTSRWQPGELIADHVCLSLPDKLPIGEYTIVAGVYDAKTMKRLMVQNNSQNYIQVTTISVK